MGRATKTDRFHFRLTANEREALFAQAESRGLRPSQYLRMLIQETEKKEGSTRPKKLPFKR